MSIQSINKADIWMVLTVILAGCLIISVRDGVLGVVEYVIIAALIPSAAINIYYSTSKK